MLLSDGKLIILQSGDQNQLEEYIHQLEERGQEVLGRELIFALVSEPLPGYLIPANLSWKDLQDLCKPDLQLQFRVLGDTGTKPDLVTTDVWHEFTTEEMAEMGVRAAFKDSEITEKVEAKKEAMSVLKAEIKALENEKNTLSSAIREKGQYRPMQCLVTYDYTNKQVVFSNPANDEIVKRDEMTADDFQLKFKFPQTVGEVLEKITVLTDEEEETEDTGGGNDQLALPGGDVESEGIQDVEYEEVKDEEVNNNNSNKGEGDDF